MYTYDPPTEFTVAATGITAFLGTGSVGVSLTDGTLGVFDAADTITYALDAKGRSASRACQRQNRSA